MSWWLFTPEMPVVSVAAWVVLGLALMYLSRRPAQQALLRGARLVHTQLRLASRGLQRLSEDAAQRNQLGLRELQLELVRRQLERELQRLSGVVDRDLAGFHELQRKLDEQITAVTEDYEHSAQVPPSSPEWIAAVDAIARLPGDASAESVTQILNDIHATVQSQQRDAMREYRWSVTARHKILAGMRPYWRRLASLLERVEAKTEGLQRRIRHIDRLMERFEALLAGGRVGLSAIGARFLLSGAVLGLAIAVAVFNFALLATPLSIALGEARLGPVLLGDYAAAIHTLAIFGLGMVLFESLQVTRMFPLVCGLSARARSVLAILSLCLLVSVAILGSLLAVWWQADNPGLPLQVMALLGLAVPLLLALSALPLETFCYTLPPVVAALSQMALALASVVMRLLGGLALQLGQLLVQVYDILLVIPLGLERIWLERGRRPLVSETPVSRPEPQKTVAQASTSAPPTPAAPEQVLRSVAPVRRRAADNNPGDTQS